MKNCSKCNSESVKKTSHFAQEVKGEKWEKQFEQIINYSCLGCGNVEPVKFGEDKE